LEQGIQVVLTLLLTPEQECVDLRNDLRGSKVVHPDCSTRAETTTGTTALAFSFSDFHNLTPLLLNKRKCTIWAEVDAHTAASASFIKAHGKVRFEFNLSPVNGDACR
jgi:hypothetical protein